MGLMCSIYGITDIASGTQCGQDENAWCKQTGIVCNQTLKDATNEALRDWISNPPTPSILLDRDGPHPYPDLAARLQAIISEGNNSVRNAGPNTLTML